MPVYLRVSTVFAELDRVGDTGERLLLDAATGERLYWGDVICGGMDLTLVRVQAEKREGVAFKTLGMREPLGTCHQCARALYLIDEAWLALQTHSTAKYYNALDRMSAIGG